MIGRHCFVAREAGENADQIAVGFTDQDDM